MKKGFLLLFVSLQFASCIDIRFENAMPMKEEELDIFPTELIGEYRFWDTKSYVNNIALGKSGLNSFEKEITDSISEKKNPLEIGLKTFDFILTNGEQKLNEDFILKKLNDTCFIISIPRIDSIENIKSYTIIPFTLVNEILTIYAISDNQKKNIDSILQSIEEITTIREINQINKKKRENRTRKKQVEKTRYYIVNPDDSAIKQFFIKGVFEEWIFMKKI